MTIETHYSPSLNLIFDFIGIGGTVEDVFRIKAMSAKAGYVNSQTRVLALVEADMPLNVEEMRVFGERLMKELPEYTGTRTAVVTRKAGATAGTMKASRDLATHQTIQVFSTLKYALEFLGFTLAEFESAFPDSKELYDKLAD